MTINTKEEKIYEDNRSAISFYILFALQFMLVAGGMFVNIKTGISTSLLVLLMTPFILSNCSSQNFDLSRIRNGMTGIFIFIGVFCLLEIGNPNNVQEAWNISITHYAIYPIAMAMLVPVAIRDRKGIEWLLFIWSVFILIASMKGYWQKNHGFNQQELYFLYTMGGYRTHIIWSGIRYFSFFSDAANYGVHSAMGLTVFAISALLVHPKWMKIYFAIVAIAAAYSVGISGTRSAMAIPLVGLTMYALISKNVKSITISLITLITVFCFFNFTNIGEGNQYIRKMRSAFHPTEDASYLVRVENRRMMKELMADRPFGYGVGLSKGARFEPKELMPYPPDSWLVSVWVETGIVGLVFYLAAHGVLFAWCAWILLFKIKNKRLRGLLAAWLCMNAGFFAAAYANDVMQYPNSIVVYTGFALCFAGPYIDQTMQEEERERRKKEKEQQF
ncbi:O-antigen ligase [Bacteroides sp.]|uniref:O-antigen ligase family protein n=1 Tax=Bacteroides sp. TaxID=29523 RepID=UPI0025C301DF|nr:O-antigen ligase family protein [Bacteroides sp.]